MPPKTRRTRSAAAAALSAAVTTVTATTTTAAASADSDAPAPKRAKRSAGKGKKVSASNGAAAADADEDTTKTTKIQLKAGSIAPVDAYCPLASNYHVYQDISGPWDFTGNQTNIGTNNNKFYILQLLESDDKKQYRVWTRWGRVGVPGQNKILPGTTLGQCKAQFCKKFHDKTLNDWEDKDSFVKHDRKYDMVKIDYGADAKERDEMEKALKTADDKKPIVKKESKLDVRVKSLMELIFDVKAMTAAVVEMKYDVKKMPLGKLTKEQIKAGYESLKHIEGLIKRNAPRRQLVDASSEFYTRIPHVFGMRVPPVIDDVGMVKEKIQLLEALEDIKTALKLIDEKHEQEDIATVDKHYASLHCGLRAVDRGSDEWDMVQTYIHNTHGRTHAHYTIDIIDLFSVDKKTPFKDLGNRKLLWHGSRLTNWAGILSQGLRIAPPEAPVTGYMFGKGVYFADACSKSANYCFTNRRNNTGLLLLCDVSLGKPHERLEADCLLHQHLPKGTHSTLGKGKQAPDPKQTITVEDGVEVPLGKLKPTGVVNPRGFTLEYNEYIVYDTSQVRFRYLIRASFNYK